MARSTEQRFLEMSLVFLEEQEQQLCSIIHEKIGQVLKTGRAWLSDGNEESARCSFREMNQMIEDTVQFVSQISNEIQGGRQGSLPLGASVTSTMKASSDSSSLPVDDTERTSVESRMKKMETAITEITDNVKSLMTRQTKIENGMGDLSVKQSDTEDKWVKQFDQVTDTVTDLRQKADEYVQQHDMKIRSLKEELQTVKNVQDELKKDMETSLVPLDPLQQDVKKITDELSSLKPKIQVLETKCNRSVVGFTAGFKKDVTFTKGAIVTEYTYVKCNTDGSFDEKTGIFTAPVKGMYGVCLRVWQVGDGIVNLTTYKTSTQQSKDEIVLGTRTGKAGSCDTAVSVTDLDITDTICIKVYDISGNPGLNLLAQFSCFLIS